MRRYGYNELEKYGGNRQRYSHRFRLGWITFVDEIQGTVNVKWIDYPGGRENVPINQAAFGGWNFPVVGAVVLIGMREGEIPEILRYETLGYANQVDAGAADQLHPGEWLFQSFSSISDTEGEGIPIPQPTGTELKLDSHGRVLISSGTGDSWALDPADSITSISANSMDHKISTEAGIMEFGIAHVIDQEGNDSGLVFKDRVPFPIGKPFTHFRLRVLETSDLDPLTAPEVDDPFVELTLGTKLKSDGSEVEKTTSNDAVTNKEIAIYLNTKAGIGFKFLVDKDGNVTMTVKDGKKFKVSCDDIEFGGSGNEQPVVLKAFIDNYHNTHKHIGNQGKPTSTPIITPPTSPTSPSTTNVVSKSTEVE